MAIAAPAWRKRDAGHRAKLSRVHGTAQRNLASYILPALFLLQMSPQ